MWRKKRLKAETGSSFQHRCRGVHKKACRKEADTEGRRRGQVVHFTLVARHAPEGRRRPRAENQCFLQEFAEAAELNPGSALCVLVPLW